MKLFHRILLVLSILISIIYFKPAIDVFLSITTAPDDWQAGVDSNSTWVWFVVITLGFAYLFFQTILAIFGLLFGYSGRKISFWLLLLPGFIGVMLGILWLVLFMLYDAEWPASWDIIAVLFFPPAITFINGRFVRKKLHPKILMTNSK